MLTGSQSLWDAWTVETGYGVQKAFDKNDIKSSNEHDIAGKTKSYY